ncbi:MAG: translation initiation factor IF-3, partial [Chloroflexota bacterium]|nr:translation initiation factor IF-3 [Chloroflexota bacterium]
GFYRRYQSIARQYRVNERISSPQVRVIGDDGAQLGVMEVARALQLARDAEVDLVEVAPNSDPPVCRLLDYGKLLYLTSKKERESKKGQRSTEQKEVRFRPNIGSHDLDAKTRKIREFIGEGSKVKLTVRFRGREAAHQQLGLSVLKRVADELKDEVRLERPPAMEGRALSMVLIPALAATKEKGPDDGPDKNKQDQIEVLADAQT